ncbi:hypothetical protein [Bradyrhizobium guangzhouense]|uniref:hypothetical protein n=1 Tax=Bradyrhizobium guangzhouense TaxID=1325095 RepID=UPI001009CDF9|nr:hypothetical protein [Bradyrhizobium guangzhouense]RXH16940.1 hypothetical protein EAS54_16340 [Bradyrhizobium guangzhouense]
MATPTEGAARPPWLVSFSVKLLCAAIAVLSIAWSLICLPIFANQTRLAGARELILRNVPLSDADLDPLGAALARAAAEGECVPQLDRDAAIVRLRLAENAFVPERAGSIDTRMEQLEAAVRKSLNCAPTDAYLWLVLFWVKNQRNGLSAADFDLLRMSYRLGPNEGWVARKRGHLALVMFDALPPDLADQVVSEFARLVKTELYTEAIELMAGPGWPHRDRLLAGLSAVPERNKAIFLKAMADLGYDVDGSLRNRDHP